MDGYSLLTDSLRQKFVTLQRTGVSGKRYIDIVFGGSAADRMLFLIGWDTNSNQSLAGGGVLIYDVAANKVVSTFNTPYRLAPFDRTDGTPTVHLTPDGKTVVIEQYEWGQSPIVGSTVLQRFKTGTVALYSADTGANLSTVHLGVPPGASPKLVDFSYDSNFMYYAAPSSLHIVDLTNAEDREIPLPENFAPTAVVTADD